MYKIYGAYIKYKVMRKLGVSRKKSLRHIVITDRVTLDYWKKVYSQITKP